MRIWNDYSRLARNRDISGSYDFNCMRYGYYIGKEMIEHIIIFIAFIVLMVASLLIGLAIGA
jgi:hypothetical protein